MTSLILSSHGSWTVRRGEETALLRVGRKDLNQKQEEQGENEEASPFPFSTVRLLICSTHKVNCHLQI